MFDLFERIEEDFSLLDRKAVFALVYTATGLTCIFYLKNTDSMEAMASALGVRQWAIAIEHSESSNLPLLAYWVGVSVTFYFIVPALVLKFALKKKLSDYGLNFHIEQGFLKLLLQCVAVMTPLVYLMSLTSGFEARYPFLKVFNGEPYLSSTLLAWELIYFLQFFGLEFFFRGFLLHSLKPSLGSYSIFAMMVPYCMIHWGKPMPETFAAIFAGIFLGWLSYRNGNIWMGLVLHCIVAFSMDVMALFNKGLLF
ncbi:MAG TPA: CPBP family intramembrane glutamic endopeptidase [Pyrinomonadaceae bacterium]|nr:CPBP family intramembrane glutamic endopeptidase [Pyrinomonadaceae bacterium]